jgi:large subunit ribosomal protein L1
MPSPKTGTVTFALSDIIKELKAGKIEFRVDKEGNIHAPIGKVSFPIEHLGENLVSLVQELVRLKPASAKGTYLRNVSISSTMGPGIAVDPNDITRVKG